MQRDQHRFLLLVAAVAFVSALVLSQSYSVEAAGGVTTTFDTTTNALVITVTGAPTDGLVTLGTNVLGTNGRVRVNNAQVDSINGGAGGEVFARDVVTVTFVGSSANDRLIASMRTRTSNGSWTALAAFNVQMGAGDDRLDITDVAEIPWRASIAVSLDGGSDSDLITMDVNSTASIQGDRIVHSAGTGVGATFVHSAFETVDVDPANGTVVTITGASSAQRIVRHDEVTIDPSAIGSDIQLPSITSLTVNATTSDDEVTVDSTSLFMNGTGPLVFGAPSILRVNGLAGDDEYVIEGGHRNVIVTDNDGITTMDVQLAIKIGSAISDSTQLVDSGASAVDLVRVVGLAQAENFEIRAGMIDEETQDHIVTYPVGVSVSLDGGGGDDIIAVREGSPATSVSGGAGANALILRGTAGNDMLNVDGLEIFVTGLDGASYDSTFAMLTVDGAGGVDSFAVTGTNPSVATTVNGIVYPGIVSVTPDAGSTQGGTEIVITGTNFLGATAVDFGGESAAAFVVDNTTQITATTPPGGAGEIDIMVVSSTGTTNFPSSGDAFEFITPLPPDVDEAPPTPTSPILRDGGLDVPVDTVTTVTVTSDGAVGTAIDRSGAEATVELAPGTVGPGGTLVVAPASVEALEARAPLPEGVALVLGLIIQAIAADGTAIVDGFNEPPRLILTIPADALPEGTLSSQLVLAFWNGDEWVTAPATVTVEADGTIRIVASLTHLSLYSVLIEPATGDFTNGDAVPDGVSAVMFGGGTSDDLIVAGGEAGCPLDRASFWVYRDGRPVGFIAGAALPSVNQQWSTLFASGIPRGTLMLLVCR